MADWDQAVESAGRVLTQDAHNIEALRITALYHLAHQSKYALAATRISDTIEALDRQEPQNAALYYKVSRPLARLSGRQSSVLQLTLSLVDRACKQEPSNCEYLVEYGYQQMLMGDLASLQCIYSACTCKSTIPLDRMTFFLTCGLRCFHRLELAAP